MWASSQYTGGTGMVKQLLSDQLRQHIAKSGLSRNAICKAAELDPSQLHRFVHGTGKLTTETLDRLGVALGLVLKKG
ncbi:MAG: helix-turn-helix domain-containing protein [Pirellulaceae bacterium]